MNLLRNRSNNYALFIVFLLLGGFVSCNITEDFEPYNGGPVELFQGKPRAVRMIPRQLLGPMPAGKMLAHTKPIQGIIVLDSGCDFKDDISSMTYLQEYLGYYANETGADLPCHYFIDPDGTCYSGRTILSPGEIHHNGPYTIRCSNSSAMDIAQARLNRKRTPLYNLDGYLLVCVLGDYDSMLVEGKAEKTLLQLLAYLSNHHEIPVGNIIALRDLYPETKNPGFYLNNYLQASILDKNIPPVTQKHRFLQNNYKPGG